MLLISLNFLLMSLTFVWLKLGRILTHEDKLPEFGWIYNFGYFWNLVQEISNFLAQHIFTFLNTILKEFIILFIQPRQKN